MVTPVYGTVQAYKDYWQERGVIVTDEDEDIAAGLLIGSEWIDGRYGSVWRAQSYKTGGRNQIREWPRLAMTDAYGYALPSDAVPREIEQATYEAARRQIASPGALMKDFSPAKYKQASIDGAVSVTFADGNAYDFQLQIPAIDAILAPILTAPGMGLVSNMSGRIVRV